MFPQAHDPGRQCQSDFTHMSNLNVTIEGPEVRAPGLSLRPDLFELGDGHPVFLRILRELIGRTAERVVAVGLERRKNIGPTACRRQSTT